MKRPELFTVDVGDTLGHSCGQRYVTTLARLSGWGETAVRRLTEPTLLTTPTPDDAVLAPLASRLDLAVPALRQALCGEFFTVFAAARPALAALARWAPVVTVSNSSPWHAHHHRQVRQECWPYLRALHTSYELGLAKPDPRVFAAVAAYHRVALDRIVHIGDSWPDDVAGARAAGSRAVWVSGRRETAQVADPDGMLRAWELAPWVWTPRSLDHVGGPGEESLLGTWKYPAEFRSDAVELVRSSGRSFASVARELGVNQETLRHWVRSGEGRQQLQAPEDASANAELARLRKENAELKTEREILRQAAAYCAQETKW